MTCVAHLVSLHGRSVDRRWVSICLRIAVGAVFAFSGLTKVTDVDETIRSVRAYRLLPEAIVPAVGAGLPVLELALAGLLLIGLLIRPAAAITIGVCTAFLIGVASAWARGLSIHCGCFGNGGASANPVPGYVRELVLNAAMILACAWLVRYPASRWSLDSVLGLRADDDLLADDLADDELATGSDTSSMGAEQ
jgi:uncharacterized membrane protein YphA (DoxX/SURF4 family)